MPCSSCPTPQLSYYPSRRRNNARSTESSQTVSHNASYNTVPKSSAITTATGVIFSNRRGVASTINSSQRRRVSWRYPTPDQNITNNTANLNIAGASKKLHTYNISTINPNNDIFAPINDEKLRHDDIVLRKTISTIGGAGSAGNIVNDITEQLLNKHQLNRDNNQNSNKSADDNEENNEDEEINKIVQRSIQGSMQGSMQELIQEIIIN
jgi:hypothetical protein